MTNTDWALHYTEPPSAVPDGAPYLVTFYIALGDETVAAPPSEYYPGTPAYLHHSRSDPQGNWYVANLPLARLLDRAIAAGRAGRYHSARPVDATVYSWQLVASWAVPLAVVIAIVAWRGRLKSARRPAREALA